MGGHGSTRWGTTITRATTDGLPRFDVRALARAGGLRPGTVAIVTWDGTTSIAVERSSAGEVVTLR
jgi:hypothetical protein